MSDIVAQARQAREKLAAALALLQNPEAGNLIDSVAEPVARGMGALHQIESSAGAKLAENGPVALDAARAALAALQSGGDSPTADQAMEHIAASLGVIHGLAEQAKQAAQPAPAAQPDPAPAQPAAEKPAPAEVAPAPAAQPQSNALDKTQLAPSRAAPAPAAPSGGLDATLPTPTKPETLGGAAGLESTQASVRTPGVMAPTQESPKVPEPEVKKPEVEKPAAEQPNRNSKMAPAPEQGAPDGAVAVEANLGAHSPTNFYKGLSGNDVINDGGLFVATYEIPKIGTPLWVSVHMPGGYQFQAVAEVRWTRETGAGDAPPGFGCAFKNVSEEARKLVYRYVRNREPLFHDDL